MRCRFNKDGCGPGQRCEAGRCAPATSYVCAQGESDPRSPSTFHELADAALPSFVCWPDFVAQQALGLNLHRSAAGDWTLALGPGVSYHELLIKGATPKESAAALDARGAEVQTAGFVISRESLYSTATDEVSGYAALLTAAGLGTFTLRATGAKIVTHDGHAGVGGTYFDLTSTTPLDPAAVRDAVLAALLGRPLGSIAGLPGPFPAAASTELVVRLHTVRRLSATDPTAGRLLITGAVATMAYYIDYQRATRFMLEDLSGGEQLASAAHTTAVECDSGVYGRRPMLDVLWVVDDSTSMEPHRQRLRTNAANLWGQAWANGIDLRMGVASMDLAQQGALCGGRFFRPLEEEAFHACLIAPPVNAPEQPDGLTAAATAVKACLPRSAELPGRARVRAYLVVFMVTDGGPPQLSAVLDTLDPQTCALKGSARRAEEKAAAPLVQLLGGALDPQAAALLHLIGGTCKNSCNLPVSHGYDSAVQQLGGQIVDLCSDDWGPRFQVMLNGIHGCCCGPLGLERRPIVPTLAVAASAARLQRSLKAGFDYRPSSNALILLNVPYPPGASLRYIAASYRRWRLE